MEAEADGRTYKNLSRLCSEIWINIELKLNWATTSQKSNQNLSNFLFQFRNFASESRQFSICHDDDFGMFPPISILFFFFFSRVQTQSNFYGLG